MNKILLAILALSGTAFAALAPAGANSFDMASIDNDGIGPARTAWRADAAPASCRIEMRWKHDYAGQLYLKKVRICA